MTRRMLGGWVLFLGILGAGVLVRAGHAQTSTTVSQTPQWEIDAGGRMAFEVASVKQNTSDDFAVPAYPLDDGDAYSSRGGLFSSTNTPLSLYIAFAYKLTPAQSRSVASHLPNWAKNDSFDIEARAPAGSNPSKDQVRLMMQSLLAERFKLAAHRETQQGPVFALVLVKPGRPGPELRPSSGDATCADAVSGSGPGVVFDSNGFPTTCGAFMVHMAAPGNPLQLGSRNITLQYFANHISVLPGANLDRPVWDKTGLAGRFDVTFAWTPERPSVGAMTPDAAAQPVASGPTFLEALRDQLGLKLEPTSGPVEVLVIDHIEEPSAN